MATRQYIGARYVPKFYTNSVDGSTQWEANVVYEPLIYVTLTNGHMYLSKKQVPATVGTPASNVEYWLDIGDYNGFIDELQQQIDANEDAIEAINGNLDNLNYNFLRNKKVLIVGDSLSDETVQAPNWVAKLRTKCADLNTTIDNLSVGGMGWCSNTAGSGGLIDQFANVTDIYDYVILFAGINDFNSQFPVGSVGSANRTTFNGALNELKGVIHTKCPSAVVFYCTSPHTTIWTQAQKPIPHNRYRSRAYKACQRFGWLMIDTTNLPSYNLIDYASGISDGIHPVTAYAQKLCDHIIQAICAGGETPADCINRYKVAFDSPYTSNLYIDFHNNGYCELVFVLSDSIATGNQTVVSNPDGGYTDGSVITIPTVAGNIGLFMWPNSIIINIPSGLGNGYNKVCFNDGEGYDIPNCY